MSFQKNPQHLINEEITKAALKQIDLPALIKKIKPQLEKELAATLIDRIRGMDLRILEDVMFSKKVQDALIDRFARALK